MSRPIYTRGRLDPSFEQYEMMAEAIDKAEGIKTELAGQVPGMLAGYIRHARRQAADAMAGLITAHPNDDADVFRLQKQIAAYVEVMHWVETTLQSGELAEQEWQEKREAILQNDEEEV